MQLLLARGRTRAHRQGHGKCISEMAVACRKRGVPSLRRGRYGADGMYRMLSRRRMTVPGPDPLEANQRRLLCTGRFCRD